MRRRQSRRAPRRPASETVLGRRPGGGQRWAATRSVDVADGEIPEETAGPYPGDGSNGPNVLTESGVVRSDITSSFGSASGAAEGVPLTLRLKVYDLDGDDGSVLAGAAVYAWHCDRDGPLLDVRRRDAVTRTTCAACRRPTRTAGCSSPRIFPGCYAGRWPHVHFEVYESLDAATSAHHKLRTSQLAFPQDVCEQVYAPRATRLGVATWPASAWTPTGSSPTATPCRWPRCPGQSTRATSRPSVYIPI